MGVWLGPRGKKAQGIDLSSFTAKGNKWNGTEYVDALAPTLSYSSTNHTLNVSISKQWHGNAETGWGNDQAGIAVSGPVDLTKYSKLTVNFSALSGSGHVAVYVSTSNTDFSRSRDLNQYDFSATPVELDVSGLSGSYYIGIAIEAIGIGESTQTFTKSITINSITATA